MTQDSIIDRTKCAVAAFTGDFSTIVKNVSSLENNSDDLRTIETLTKWCHVRLLLQYQRQIEWCWAAGVVNIDRFFNHNSILRQCTIANIILRQHKCCINPSSIVCDQPYSMTNALTMTEHLQSHLLRPLTYCEIKQEIDSGKPICAHISWIVSEVNEGGHLPMIIGYRDALETLAIADPLYGLGEVDYSVFKDSYRQFGHWDESYYLK